MHPPTQHTVRVVGRPAALLASVAWLTRVSPAATAGMPYVSV